jgi:hypothetical protein
MAITLRILRPKTAGPPPEPFMLARSLEATVREAWERSLPSWSATTALHTARSRKAVRDATPQLRALARALRETRDIDPDALRQCLALVEDGFRSPLYAGSAEALRRECGRLRFRLLEPVRQAS